MKLEKSFSYYIIKQMHKSMNKRISSSFLPLIVSLGLLVTVIQLSLANNRLFLPQLLVSGTIILILVGMKTISSSKLSD